MLIKNGRTPAKGNNILSEREIEVLQLAADGYCNKEIATQLEISNDTVDTHNRRLSSKLEARNMKHAVAQGFRKKLIK